DKGHADGEQPRNRDLSEDVELVERVQETRLEQRKDRDQEQQEEWRGVACEKQHEVEAPRLLGGGWRHVAHQYFPLRPRGQTGDRRTGPLPHWIRLLDLAQALGLIDIVGGDGDRLEQDQFLGLGAVAQILDEGLDGGAALAAGELLDGGVETAVADRGQRLGQSVEADDRDVEPPLLGDLQGAQGHVVIGGDDYVGRRVEAGEYRLGDGGTLLTGEVGGLLGNELILVRHRIEHVVNTHVAVDGRAGAGLA